MSKQLIGIGAAANDGTGDNLRAAFTKANANFTEVFGAVGKRIPIICFDGDSKSGEPRPALSWVSARSFLEFRFGSDYGVGGTASGSTGSGLTSSARLASTSAAIAALYAAGETVDIVLTIGTNDGTTIIESETVLANVRKYHNTMRAAGLRYLIVMAVDPRNGSSALRNGINYAFKDYCDAVDDAFFVDTRPFWLDPATTNATFNPIGGAAGLAGAVTGDGLHGSAFGSYQKAFALEPICRQLYRRRLPEMVNNGDVFNATTNRRGNVMGANGRFVALGGTNSLTNGGSGTNTGTPPLGFTLTGALSGTMSIDHALTTTTPTLESVILGAPAPQPSVRLTLSGTPSADVTLQYRLTRDGGSTIAGNYVPALLFGLNAVEGLRSVKLGHNGFATGSWPVLGSDTGGASSTLPQMNGLHYLRPIADIPVATMGNRNFDFVLLFKAGIPVSGSIDLISRSDRIVPALPAPAA